MADFKETVEAFAAKQLSDKGFRASAYWLGWPQVWAILSALIKGKESQSV